MSVIVAPIYEGFTLSSLGSPGDAAQRFLDTVAAPAGGTKRARLVAASDRWGCAGCSGHVLRAGEACIASRVCASTPIVCTPPLCQSACINEALGAPLAYLGSGDSKACSHGRARPMVPSVHAASPPMQA